MKTGTDFPTINTKKAEGIKEDGVPYKVLITDDSLFIVKQLSQILASEGYEIVATAANGADGFEKYKELYPDVDIVTLDITMPKMNGVEALEKIIAFNKKAQVIMISAIGKKDLVTKALLLGAKSYIVKPLNRKKVLERILSVLNNEVPI